MAEAAIAVTHNEVARKITGPQRKEALRLAKDAADREQLASYIQRYREIVNFVYWRFAAKIEQTDEMLTTRKLIHQGNRSLFRGRPDRRANAYQPGPGRLAQSDRQHPGAGHRPDHQRRIDGRDQALSAHPQSAQRATPREVHPSGDHRRPRKGAAAPPKEEPKARAERSADVVPSRLRREARVRAGDPGKARSNRPHTAPLPRKAARVGAENDLLNLIFGTT